MIGEVISALLQIGLVLLVAWIAYRIMRRPESPFSRFIGLRSAPWPAIGLGLAVGILFAALLLLVPDLRTLAAAQGTVASDAARGNLAADALIALAVAAVLKTALSEELLFRGLIGRSLIRRLGFGRGNLIQAALFGAVHLLLLLLPQARIDLILLIVAGTGALGWVNGWLNERWASGSILPGWAAHGTANLIAYMVGTGALG